MYCPQYTNYCVTDPYRPNPDVDQNYGTHNTCFVNQSLLDKAMPDGLNSGMTFDCEDWSSESKRRMPNFEAIDKIKTQIANDHERKLVSGGPCMYNATMLGELMSRGGLDMKPASSILMEAKKMQESNSSASNQGDNKSLTFDDF